MNKLIIVFVMIAMVVMCAGCGSTPEISSDGTTGPAKEIMTDEETGVQYIVVYRADGVAVTPRYNADGSFRVKRSK